MSNITRRFLLFLALAGVAFGGSNKVKPVAENTAPVLWREPGDIHSRNLFFGPGGKNDEPHGTLTFEREDMNGSNPKFIVHDENGIKWTVKLGNEARPETVATRLVWAAGYFATEDYLIPRLHVEGMPAHLKRGQNLVVDGSVENARLKRHNPDEKKIGEWSWRHDPFAGTREWNGLRVMMALINNWDLKDANNEIYADKKSGGQFYLVSDLGASFGAPTLIIPPHRSKDDLGEYRHSRFIRHRSAQYVSFETPAAPSLLYVFTFFPYARRLRLEWIGRHVPREDARWIGNILGRLSDAQIRDAFRAGGYSPGEVEAYSKLLADRIAQLLEL